MKKLSLYILLVLMVCNVGFAECIKGDCNNGRGTFTYTDGSKYTGEWKNGKWHGEGISTLRGVGTYDGEFKDDEYHGLGTFTYTDGSKYAGEWKNGKWHGEGTYTAEDGSITKGIWKKNELIKKQ